MASQNQNQFLSRLNSGFSFIRRYEDPSLLKQALATIPVSQLEQSALSSCSSSSDYRDCLLIELLAWFKRDFFKWVNKPVCDYCGAEESKMQNIGATRPNSSEQVYQAGITEIYLCQSCNQQTRFPRYNDPSKLLTWRRGRCGEWANCFTLCCIAMGFEARYIMDWTDHVWTEVYSIKKQRWIHCDSCEDKCDTPHLYEAGWGKQLNYVIAFGSNEIVDVTRRYTQKWDQVLQRRTLVSEEWLASTIDNFNESIASQLPPFMIESWINRREMERIELYKEKEQEKQDENREKDVKPEEKEGRISGAKEWKEARGEAGNPNLKQPNKSNNTQKCTTSTMDEKATIDDQKQANLVKATFISNWNSSAAFSKIQSFCIEMNEPQEHAKSIEQMIEYLREQNGDKKIDSNEDQKIEIGLSSIQNLLNKWHLHQLFPLIDVLRVALCNEKAAEIISKNRFILAKIILICMSNGYSSSSSVWDSTPHVIVTLRFFGNLMAQQKSNTLTKSVFPQILAAISKCVSLSLSQQTAETNTILKSSIATVLTTTIVNATSFLLSNPNSAHVASLVDLILKMYSHISETDLLEKIGFMVVFLWKNMSKDSQKIHIQHIADLIKRLEKSDKQDLIDGLKSLSDN